MSRFILPDSIVLNISMAILVCRVVVPTLSKGILDFVMSLYRVQSFEECGPRLVQNGQGYIVGIGRRSL